MTEPTRNGVLDGTITIPATLWLALHTAAPGDDGASAVVAVARRPFTRSPATTAASPTNVEILFAPFAAGVRVSHWSAHTDEVGGACRWVGEFDSPRIYEATDAAVISAGALTFTLTG